MYISHQQRPLYTQQTVSAITNESTSLTKDTCGVIQNKLVYVSKVNNETIV